MTNMAKQGINTEPRLRYLLLLLLFGLAAVGLNYTRLPLFFSVEFIFGSAIAVLALLLLGRSAAIAVGCVAASVTLFIWGHPYAWLIFTAEIIWLSWRWRPDNGLSLVKQDVLFWLCVGLPAVSLLYAYGLDVKWQTAVLIALKQMINGVFNTLLASLLILVLQSQHWVGRFFMLPLISLRQLLFHILIALTLFAGCIPLLIDARKQQAEYVSSVEQRLQLLAATLQKQLQVQGPVDQLTTAEVTALLDLLLPDDSVGVLLFDSNGSVLNSAGLITSLDSMVNSIPEPGFSHWQPEGVSPLLQRWSQSRFVIVQHPLTVPGIGAIIIEYSAMEVMAKLEQDSARQLTLLVAFLLLVTLVANWLSRVISLPLRRLALASEKLKSSIAAGADTDIPTSKVEEYNTLGQNLQAMSRELAAAFTIGKANEAELARKVNEQTKQLQQANSQLEAILAAASDFSIIATNQEGIISYFSRGAERMLGYSAAELVGKQSPAILHVADEVTQRSQELTAQLQQPITGFRAFVVLAEQQGTETRQWHYVRKDGSCLPVSLTVTPILNQSGVITGYLGVAKDISERHRNEKLKNEFISTVSHELRTPLTSLYAAIRMVNSGRLGDLPAKVANLLQLAENNSKRLGRLINDLLDIEKLTAGKFQLSLEVQSLQPLVIQAINEISSYATQYKVILQTDFAAEPLFARIDAARFVQVVTNLLSNAIKFSPVDAIVKVSMHADSAFVRLEVTDLGEGIADDFKDRIFEKFAQNDAASTRQQGGTGLGLAISKELTEKMAGNIGFVSVPGQETTFWLSFSRCPAPDQNPVETAAEVTGSVEN
ncbi:PAS domain S-box-containing protein [Arsukibacterium tuosuense]|uniref:histidine kinase n=1 Tax=Arsukibacterium tuosuense TaxID=1323745 RepID=A0A285J2H5_9GAMM|nr:ATP-binding protein [Arsukibacterium tuosuense]SNY54263.1 PAS domain S-box-containing protein [Arsukibacterium tuosuense]